MNRGEMNKLIMDSHSCAFTIQTLVLPFLGGAAKVALSHVSAPYRALLSDFTRLLREMYAKRPSSRIKFAVMTKRRDLCEIARLWVTPSQCDFINRMRQRAARIGSTELFNLADTWNVEEDAGYSETDVNRELEEAARGGHIDLCRAIKHATHGGVMQYWGCKHCMVMGAVRGGHKDLYTLAKKWETKHPSKTYLRWSHPLLFYSAARGPDQKTALEMCDFLLSEYLKNLSDSRPKSPELTDRLFAYVHVFGEVPDASCYPGINTPEHIRWLSLAFNNLLEGAARSDYRELCICACKIAIKYNIPIDNNMLIGAARGGHRDLCELALQWKGTCLSARVFSGAARGGHADILEFLVDMAFNLTRGRLRGTEFVGYCIDDELLLRIAHTHEQGAIISLIGSWITTHKYEQLFIHLYDDIYRGWQIPDGDGDW